MRTALSVKQTTSVVFSTDQDSPKGDGVEKFQRRTSYSGELQQGERQLFACHGAAIMSRDRNEQAFEEVSFRKCVSDTTIIAPHCAPNSR